MGDISDSLAAAANNIITTLGEASPVTFSRFSKTEYNVNTSTIDDVTETTFTAVAAPSPYRIGEIDGEIIQQNDVRLYVYSTTEPLIDDTVTFDSVNYRVMDVEKLRAQGVNVAYVLQLRV